VAASGLSGQPILRGIFRRGYVAPIVAVTGGYALFQVANNTAVMKDVGPDQRGVVSGLLNLSRNLGLITGASAMGAVFALAAGADVASAGPDAATSGMRGAFAVAAVLATAALAIAVRAGARSLSAVRAAS
jgi:hypothetical protein